ncbi:MurR/RpiR family transcriptional regulator [Denitrobaculum tricleocarpae]|uniref:MurR/RpiR family transcriptional regulator n=1 Tax=Denitrobaculum tricleocarpae TaxID=2591009 RepID=A0A545TY62_9PROT|nr:MurR/RpiR family transcriptional regulator [Denitrobaculum tricleocarpae]TQV82166.1 MurR/RpiR family transcriptional regulator [Denitrobaculum tricleocarpae]
MPEPVETIGERLQSSFDALTRAERQLANAILENYPVSGLGSITTLAANAKVSTPTVVRMVRKLGFPGFPQFQAALRRELEAKITNPIAKHDTWAENAPDGHILNRFTEAVIDNIHQTLAQIDPASFDAACALLADPKRTVFVAGGRITRALADYFYMHLQMIRRGVTSIESRSNSWPHSLLDMQAGDVLVIFDNRRYENSTIKLAELAREQGVKIILFTDQWRSPVSRCADLCFSSRIVVPSAWDSSVVIMLLLETMIAEVQKQTWDGTRERIEALEEVFDRTRFFRKFN